MHRRPHHKKLLQEDPLLEKLDQGTPLDDTEQEQLVTSLREKNELQDQAIQILFDIAVLLTSFVYLISTLKTLLWNPPTSIPRSLLTLLTLYTTLLPLPLLLPSLLAIRTQLESLLSIRCPPRILALLSKPTPFPYLLMAAVVPGVVVFLWGVKRTREEMVLDGVWWGFPAVLVAGGWIWAGEREDMRVKLERLDKMKYGLKGA